MNHFFKIHTIKLKYFFALIAMALTLVSAMAQREKNHIFLFDCTGSMHKGGLWATAQSALDKNISLRASIPGSSFTVVPFGDSPYQVITFANQEYAGKKANISEAFATYIKQAKFTHISDVLRAGFAKVNPNKENEIYLFTDGMPSGGDSPEKVAKTIADWCGTHKNSKLYYVALTKGVINPVIKQAIDACADASIVQCENGIVPVITRITEDVSTNLDELHKELGLSFSVPGEYALAAQCADPNFEVTIVGNKASGGNIKIKVSPKGNQSVAQLHQLLQGEKYEFPVLITSADSRYQIANPQVNVHVYDKTPSALTIGKGVDELQHEGVRWYDSFLWSDAADEQKAVWDLKPMFENELKNSRLALKFQVGEGQTNDFQAWFNGQPISNGSTIHLVPQQPAVLEVKFNHDAATGKRYFSLIPASVDGINIINGQPLEKYEGTSLRTEYKVDWNPLFTLLFWLLVALLAALVLWFVALKRIFFPTIKVSRVQLTGPAPYFAQKRMRGARQVVLTSNRRSQNVFSRLFTGKIIFVKAEHFSPELTILPSGSKKMVRLRSEGNAWDVSPSAIFAPHKKGSITNRRTHVRTEIDFN